MPNTDEEANDYGRFVNNFIGTGGHGHTFPGATLPFGMVQLSPDTRIYGWDACGGYYYSDSTIMGFTHTHLSGTGIGDYGDLLFMPTVSINQPTEYPKNYSSRFSHKNEKAKPGYYQVLLENDKINVELTTTMRAGFHKYTYPKERNASLLIDLVHGINNQINTDLRIDILSDTEIRGYKRSQGWAKDQNVFFYAIFSRPFAYVLFENDQKQTNKTSVNGQNCKAIVTFDELKKGELLVKVGISTVDEDGARKNLEAELPAWDFDEVVRQAKIVWHRQLSKIDIETGNKKDKTIFYTALYHASISPNLNQDVDGRYRGMDQKIYTAENLTNYTVFSLWDTYRALHPLLTIIDPERNTEMIKSLIDKYEKGGILPMWELSSNYTGTMIGYHAVPVIVDAYVKGNRNFDIEKAYEACIKSSLYDTLNIAPAVNRDILHNKLIPFSKDYKNSLGYIPGDLENESVAKGLEYAYNDWCIAQFSKLLGKKEAYDRYSKLSLNYRNYYDPSTGFMRGKLSDGSWRSPFNAKTSNHRNDDYCEGNAWQWLWYVPHDISGLASLMGGVETLQSKLDSLFAIDSELEGENVSADISGLIGQYAHGNEPSHHTTHIYNYVEQPWKVQELTDKIMQTLYFNDPNGLPGNEDCGQMSAWYILNAMGFYSFCPGSDLYSIGRPLFDEVAINLENGKTFKIKAINNSAENIYIQSVSLNGDPLQIPFFSHRDIMAGGEMIFQMGPDPNKSWGVNEQITLK